KQVIEKKQRDMMAFRRFHLKRIITVLLALTFHLPAAWSLLSAPTGAADAATVRVGVPTLSMVVIAFTAAKEKGYYKDEGLDVELIWMSAPVAAQALL